MFTFEEIPISQDESLEGQAFTLVYKAAGEVHSNLVAAYALSATPGSVFRQSGQLFRKDIKLQPDGWGQYIVTVPYGKLDRSSVPIGSSTFSFDTSGATVNVKASKEHIASYPENGDWHKGAINVKEDGDVEGADIVVPALKLSYTFNHPQGIVTEGFARALASATGHTNADPFRGFAAGELLFIGAAGSDGSQSEATVTYDFIASSNESSLTIGAISGIVKQGHHLAWVEFEDDVDTDEPIRKAKRVHVERMYDAIGFASAFGWS